MIYAGIAGTKTLERNRMENKWTLHPNGVETIEKDHLYTALSQAQVEFPTIQVNRKAFKNEYADLYALLKPVYPILHKYGLSIRPWGGIDNGVQVIGARLMHKSGQYETNVFLFEVDPCKNPNDQLTHKKQGAFTYFNRNHIKDMLGLLIGDDPDDDDGQGHYVHTVHPRIETISKEQEDEINHVLDGHRDIYEQVIKGFGISSLSQIPKEKFYATIDRIRDLKYKKSELNLK